ncbi:MAG: hypothetical protein LCI00_16000 [Chloroflexi bacterium]|nr:hypothetical protein [Chloroflexota bacterium]MCC6892734.1 hypothetical protein [Anaerolineae bacterium]
MNIPTTTSSSLAWQRLASILPFTALALLAVLLWLPFGLQVGYYADEWTVMADIQKGAFLTGSVRPFELLTWFTAYHLAPDSFAGLNGLMLVMIAAKAISAYLLLTELKLPSLFAFGAAALLLLYPADSGVFYMGSISIHTSGFLLLLALWLLARFWRTGRRGLWLPIFIASALCLGMYEGVFPLFVLAPFMLLYLEGKFSRRLVAVSLIWFILPLVFGLRIIATLNAPIAASSYQSMLLAEDKSVGAIVGSLWRANRVILADGWVSAVLQTVAPTGWSGLRNVPKNTLANPYIAWVLVGALVVAVTVFVLSRREQISPSSKRLLLLLVASPVIITLGFLLYALTNLRGINLRTLLYASTGGALLFASVLWLVGKVLRRPALVFVVGVVLLGAVGLSSLLFQHQHYATLGRMQTPVLQTLVQAAPGVETDTTLVVIDETPERLLSSTFNDLSLYLEGAARVIYADSSLSATICYPAGAAWGQFNEQCRFDVGGISLLFDGVAYWSRGYEQLAVFRYTADGDLQLVTDLSAYTDQAAAYQPLVRVRADAPLPTRAVTMLGLVP